MMAPMVNSNLNDGSLEQNPFNDKRLFIIKLGKALHKYGTPAYRLEAHLQNVSRVLGLQADFLVTPTSLTFLLSQSPSPQNTLTGMTDNQDQQDYNHIVRVAPGDINLGALARLDALVDEVESGQRTLVDAIELIDATSSKSNTYGKPITFLAFGLTSGSFAILMNTGWNSVLWSTLFGFIVAMITFCSEKFPRINNMLEPFLALIIALLASFVAIYDSGIHIPLVILSSIIVYIPGLALTLGLSELAARHLTSGTARIMDAAMSLFKLYFGAILGLALAQLLWGEQAFTSTNTVPEWTLWFAVTILALSLSVLFKTRKRDIVWAVLSGYVAFGATLWGSHYLGPALGAFVGAFALGIYSNAFSRLMNLPSSIVLLLGLVMLVPGSKVYIGLNTLVSGQSMINATDIGSQSFLIFMSLIAGLIFSDVMISTEKTL